ARAQRAARRRADAPVRAVLEPGSDARVRLLRRRPLQLVYPAFAAALLERRPRRAVDALVRAAPLRAGDRAGDALPRGLPVAAVACRSCAGVGVPRALARGARARRGAPARGRRGAP